MKLLLVIALLYSVTGMAQTKAQTRQGHAVTGRAAAEAFIQTTEGYQFCGYSTIP